MSILSRLGVDDVGSVKSTWSSMLSVFYKNDKVSMLSECGDLMLSSIYTSITFRSVKSILPGLDMAIALLCIDVISKKK